MREPLHIQVGDEHIIDFSLVQLIEKCDVSESAENDAKGIPLTKSLKIMWKPEANLCETFQNEGVLYIGFKTEKERDDQFWGIQNLLHKTFRKRFIEL